MGILSISVDGSVTESKIANEAVITDKIANNALTSEKLDSQILERINSSTVTSDIRLKENFEEIRNASEKVRMLNAYTYNLIGHDNRTAGIIAQDLIKVLPEGVRTNPETGIMSVDYSMVVALLVNALNEKQSDIEQMTKRLEEIESRLQKLEA